MIIIDLEELRKSASSAKSTVAISPDVLMALLTELEVWRWIWRQLAELETRKRIEGAGEKQP